MKQLLISSMVLLLVGCSSSKMTKSESPGWYTNPPAGDGIVSAVSTAESSDEQTAVSKAAADCRAEISRETSVKVDALEKRMREEVGDGKDPQLSEMFSSVLKTVSSEVLTGSRINKQETYVLNDGRYKAYVMVIVNMAEKINQKMQADKDVWNRFRASQLNEELDKETEKLNQFKKDNDVQ